MQMIRHCIDQCWDVLQTVSDPEIPVLSVVDLGMIRGVEINDQQEIIVRLTQHIAVARQQICSKHKLLRHLPQKL